MPRKKGVSYPRGPKIPLAKRRQWLERHESGEPLNQIAQKQGYNVRTVTTNVERARQERDFEFAQREQLREALRRHQEDMISQLRRFREAVQAPSAELLIQPIDIGLEDLNGSPELMSRRVIDLGPLTDLGQAVSIECIKGIPSEMCLVEEGYFPGIALREHLPKDPLWRVLDEWKEALLEVFKARAVFNRFLWKWAEDRLHLKVIGSHREPGPHLTTGAIFVLRVGATKRALGDVENAMPWTLQERGGELEAVGGPYSMIVARHLEHSIKEEFLTTLEAVSNTEQAHMAANTYKRLEQHTNQVHRSIDEYVFLHHIPGRCRLCKKLGGQ